MGLRGENDERLRTAGICSASSPVSPEFAAANIHLAELEIARHDLTPAMARLERVAVACSEPEALALLGRLHLRVGQRERARQEIASARLKFEALLARHPLAFADHAAEFYLGAGDDAELAWVLAQKNLTLRQTRRAYTLAIQAARATNRQTDARALEARMRAALGPFLWSLASLSNPATT